MNYLMFELLFVQVCIRAQLCLVGFQFGKEYTYSYL